MLGRFFDTSEVDTLAVWIVNELKKSVPTGHIDYGETQIQKKLGQLEHHMRGRMSQLQLARLNVYQKARLGVRLQAALQAEGYEKSFYQPFSYEVVRLVALMSAAR